MSRVTPFCVAASQRLACASQRSSGGPGASVDLIPTQRRGNISDVNDAYATYLLLFHTAEYEARCLPAAFPPGSVIGDRGLALTGVCADLAAPLAADVVEWIRDGRPTENG